MTPAERAAWGRETARNAAAIAIVAAAYSIGRHAPDDRISLLVVLGLMALNLAALWLARR